MVDWRKGGWSGSINRWAIRDVRDQLRKNPVAAKARYPLIDRLLRTVFSPGSFLTFLVIYLSIDVSVAILEALSRSILEGVLPGWPSAYTSAATSLLHAVPGYLIGAQVGLLGVMSLALALVTLIAQKEEASVDVQVYYHESLFFGIVASSLALIFVLTFQLFWPLQLLLKQAGAGATNPSFRIFLLGTHALWFAVNIVGILHFITVTFRFVQRSEKQKLRERYTANVLLPYDIRHRLRMALYRSMGEEVWTDAANTSAKRPLIAFGSAFGEPYESELSSSFATAVQLYDVRATLVRWALRRWCGRCSSSNTGTKSATRSSDTPTIWFTPTLDRPLRKHVVWCRRRGGVPLTQIERLAIRLAFRFVRVKDAR